MCIPLRLFRTLDITVYAGSVHKSSGGVSLAVSQFIPHPDYNATELSMDFALIELEDCIPLRNKNVILQMHWYWTRGLSSPME